jgi:hypothetical protein
MVQWDGLPALQGRRRRQGAERECPRSRHRRRPRHRALLELLAIGDDAQLPMSLSVEPVRADEACSGGVRRVQVHEVSRGG